MMSSKLRFTFKPVEVKDRHLVHEWLEQPHIAEWIHGIRLQDSNEWNRWFVENVVDPLDAMVQIIPTSIVAKDVSFFKTGPNLASSDF